MKENVAQHRKDVHSATYWLVWHVGLSIEKAESMLVQSRGKLVKPLARLGRTQGNACFKALGKWIDTVNRIDRMELILVRAMKAEDALAAAESKLAQAVRKERDAAVRDAERYRWLRDHSVPPHNFYLSVPIEFKDERYKPQEIDAEIDAAIRARAEKGAT